MTGVAPGIHLSEEGVRLKRKRHEILGLESAKRGIRYPSWQILEGRKLLPALPRLFAIPGNDPWRLFRFLRQHHSELGGDRALDALRRVDGVLAAAENTATGASAQAIWTTMSTSPCGYASTWSICVAARSLPWAWRPTLCARGRTALVSGPAWPSARAPTYLTGSGTVRVERRRESGRIRPSRL
jgi:hypothetical protein